MPGRRRGRWKAPLTDDLDDLADDAIGPHETPITAVVTVVPVVAHDEVIARRDVALDVIVRVDAVVAECEIVGDQLILSLSCNVANVVSSSLSR